MKLVVDSNCLRDDELNDYLKLSPLNIAILTSDAVIEALKGDALVGMYKSMRILSQFSKQVIVLKTTFEVCGLGAVGNDGLSRIIDIPRSNEFWEFCEALEKEYSNAGQLAQVLQTLGKEANKHMVGIMDEAKIFATQSVERAKKVSAEAHQAILYNKHYPVNTLEIILGNVTAIALSNFSQHPAVKEIPKPEDLINTYIFRSALCQFILGVKYASDGGVPDKLPKNIANDIIDSHFATYATYFDGILSNDKLTRDLYLITTNILNHFQPNNFIMKNVTKDLILSWNIPSISLKISNWD